MLKNNDLFNEKQETFTAIKAKSFVVTPSLPESFISALTLSDVTSFVSLSENISSDDTEELSAELCVPLWSPLLLSVFSEDVPEIIDTCDELSLLLLFEHAVKQQTDNISDMNMTALFFNIYLHPYHN